jgi:Xaa-Pro aminopeptidase
MEILIHGDTHRCAALRHELPLGIIDPFPYFEVDGRRVAVISSMEASRVAEVAPGVEIIDPYELGLDELIAQGMQWDQLDPELTARAAAHLGARSLVVPNELPVAVADRLRAEGIEVIPNEQEFIRRRRSKNEAEVEGVRRAQAAADAGMAAAAELLRGDGEVTAEQVREQIRAVCAEHGAPCSGDIIVAPGAAGATGHEVGSGPLAPGEPIIIDIWPRDERSGCYADMTRTFVRGGAVADDVKEWHALCVRALEEVYAQLRPGVTGRALFDVVCDIFEAAGEPTQRTKPDGETLHDGFFHSLGHGVGLDVHEEPSLGRTGSDELVAGDVLAIEPGLYRAGYGGVRVEDLVLLTEDGYERLTDFPYALEP